MPNPKHDDSGTVAVSKRALWNVLAYMWKDEKDHWEEAADEDDYAASCHIFRELQILASESQAPTEEWVL